MNNPSCYEAAPTTPFSRQVPKTQGKARRRKGTITEFGTNEFVDTYGSTTLREWTGKFKVPSNPSTWDVPARPVWWYMKITQILLPK